ncbi:MAG: hypothetical protein K2X08_04050 [Chlamydiales bacterium]|nr:hypothetical protein [Chlamydiales bacterium]MBY0529902.1 hypothetical protein [Rhabdochlamydiaceae bacterium]
MRIAVLSLMVSLALASCNVYQTEFECPPGEGVGCSSVTEVMEMIVESDQGEDLFLKYRGSPLLSARRQKDKNFGEKKLFIARSEEGKLVLVPETEGEKR